VSGDSVVYDGLDEAGTARTGQAPRAVSAAIEVSHLTKLFGRRTAVSDVSFSVAGGEIFGFLGPNGAGKPVTELRLSLPVGNGRYVRGAGQTNKEATPQVYVRTMAGRWEVYDLWYPMLRSGWRE
jgi:ABC-type transport system involved in cytochrome bd biosynthesis fused ATPase/permease subunit